MADNTMDDLAQVPGVLRLLASQTVAEGADVAALPPRIAALQQLHERALLLQAEAEALGEPMGWDEAREAARQMESGRMAAFTQGLDELDFARTQRRIPGPEPGEDP